VRLDQFEQLRVDRRPDRVAAAVACALLGAQFLASATRADTFSVTSTSWGTATTAGTLAWAIDVPPGLETSALSA
jgi:hypothetical protein